VEVDEFAVERNFFSFFPSGILFFRFELGCMSDLSLKCHVIFD
jgi:hypothetical protein